MSTSSVEQHRQATRAMTAFRQTVLEPGAYRLQARQPLAFKAAAPAVIFLPVPELSKQKFQREPQHSSAFDDMAEAIAAKSGESYTLSYEQRVQADALLSRAFQFAVLMDGKHSSF